MKKGILSAFCILFSLSCLAQSHSFRFFPLHDSALFPQQMTMAGQIGDRIVLFNRITTQGLEVYSYDTLSQTGRRYLYAFPRIRMAAIPRPHSVAFVSAVQQGRKLNYHYLEVNGNGELLRSTTDSLSLFGPFVSLVTSPDQRHILYYQYSRVDNDAVLLLATMIGEDGQIEKTLSYAFKHDRERDDEPTVFVDNTGNTHVLVYDKFNNYKLSSDLTINTVPANEDAIISETFSIHKIKLKTMQIFQDTVSGFLHAKGLYADGQVKTVRGMYNLSLPIKRSNELRQKFTEFTGDMIKTFKKNISTSTRYVADHLQVEDMVYTDSGTYVCFRITGEPMVERRVIRSGGQFTSEQVFALSPIVTRANTWNAPKLVYLRISKDHHFEWMATKGQDVFSFRESRYNRVLRGNDRKDIVTMMYMADKHEVPIPIVVTVQNGNTVVEQLPQKSRLFSSLRSLGRDVYAALYQDPDSGEGGIMVIHPAAQ